MFEELQPLVPVVVDILKYAAYGGIAAFEGYLKSEDLEYGWKALFTKEFWSAFDPIKASKTVLVGAGMGAFIQTKIFLPLGITQTPDFIAFELFFAPLLILGVETIFKVIIRRTPLMRGWNGLKDKALDFLTKVQNR